MWSNIAETLTQLAQCTFAGHHKANTKESQELPLLLIMEHYNKSKGVMSFSCMLAALS